jgi:hypothetical protein
MRRRRGTGECPSPVRGFAAATLSRKRGEGWGEGLARYPPPLRAMNSSVAAALGSAWVAATW